MKLLEKFKNLFKSTIIRDQLRIDIQACPAIKNITFSTPQFTLKNIINISKSGAMIKVSNSELEKIKSASSLKMINNMQEIAEIPFSIAWNKNEYIGIKFTIDSENLKTKLDNFFNPILVTDSLQLLGSNPTWYHSNFHFDIIIDEEKNQVQVYLESFFVEKNLVDGKWEIKMGELITGDNEIGSMLHHKHKNYYKEINPVLLEKYKHMIGIAKVISKNHFNYLMLGI